MASGATPLEALYSDADRELMDTLEAGLSPRDADEGPADASSGSDALAGSLDGQIMTSWVRSGAAAYYDKVKSRKITRAGLRAILIPDADPVTMDLTEPADATIPLDVFAEVDPKRDSLAKFVEAHAMAFLKFAGDSVEAVGPERSGDSDVHALMPHPKPVFPGHSILVPHITEGLPQVLSPDMLSMAVQLARSSQRADICVTFGSRAGGALRNQLHLEVMYLGGDPEESAGSSFPVQRCKRQVVATVAAPGGAIVSVSELTEQAGVWPAPALVFEASEDASAEALADAAGTFVCTLLEMAMPHSVLVADNGRSLFVFPRARPGDALPSGMLDGVADTEPFVAGLAKAADESKEEPSFEVGGGGGGTGGEDEGKEGDGEAPSVPKTPKAPKREWFSGARLIASTPSWVLCGVLPCEVESSFEAADALAFVEFAGCSAVDPEEFIAARTAFLETCSGTDVSSLSEGKE